MGSPLLVTRDRVRHVRLLESCDLVLGEGQSLGADGVLDVFDLRRPTIGAVTAGLCKQPRERDPGARGPRARRATSSARSTTAKSTSGVYRLSPNSSVLARVVSRSPSRVRFPARGRARAGSTAGHRPPGRRTVGSSRAPLPGTPGCSGSASRRTVWSRPAEPSRTAAYMLLAPEVTSLARPDDVVERLHRLLDRGGVGPTGGSDTGRRSRSPSRSNDASIEASTCLRDRPRPFSPGIVSKNTFVATTYLAHAEELRKKVPGDHLALAAVVHVRRVEGDPPSTARRTMGSAASSSRPTRVPGPCRNSSSRARGARRGGRWCPG